MPEIINDRNYLKQNKKHQFLQRCEQKIRWPFSERSHNGGLDVPRVELLMASILYLYEQLTKLGFTYYQGKIVVIDSESEF